MRRWIPWTAADDDLLREHYPLSGVTGCIEVMPIRTRKAIYKRAHRIGLSAPASEGRGKYPRIRKDRSVCSTHARIPLEMVWGAA